VTKDGGIGDEPNNPTECSEVALPYAPTLLELFSGLREPKGSQCSEHRLPRRHIGI
jgi:hypothetical protein